MKTITHNTTFYNDKIKITQTISYDINSTYDRTTDIVLCIVVFIKNTNKNYYYSHSIFESDNYNNTSLAFDYLSLVETQRTINNIWLRFMNIKRKLHPIFEWIITNDKLNILGNTINKYIRNIEKYIPHNMSCCSGYSFDFFENYDKGFRYLSNNSDNKYEMDPIILL